MNIFSSVLKRLIEKLSASRPVRTPEEEAMIVRVGEVLEKDHCPTLRDILTQVSENQPSVICLRVSGRVRHLAKYARKRRIRKKNQRRLSMRQDR